MRGIKIPQRYFALKMQGAYARGGGGGGVFAGHYGIPVLFIISHPDYFFCVQCCRIT